MHYIQQRALPQPPVLVKLFRIFKRSPYVWDSSPFALLLCPISIQCDVQPIFSTACASACRFVTQIPRFTRMNTRAYSDVLCDCSSTLLRIQAVEWYRYVSLSPFFPLCSQSNTIRPIYVPLLRHRAENLYKCHPWEIIPPQAPPPAWGTLGGWNGRVGGYCQGLYSLCCLRPGFPYGLSDMSMMALLLMHTVILVSSPGFTRRTWNDENFLW